MLKYKNWRQSIRSGVCVVAAGLGATACVSSDKTLLADAKPILGQHFAMVLYRDFEIGKGFGSQRVEYRWQDGVYLRDSATTTHLIKFDAEPLSGSDFLIERSQSDRDNALSKVFTYWIGRKVTDGTYLIFPVSEHDLAPAETNAICNKDSPEGFCLIKDHAQLVTIAMATASKPVLAPAVGVIVDDGTRDGTTIQLVKDK